MFSFSRLLSNRFRINFVLGSELQQQDCVRDKLAQDIGAAVPQFQQISDCLHSFRINSLKTPIYQTYPPAYPKELAESKPDQIRSFLVGHNTPTDTISGQTQKLKFPPVCKPDLNDREGTKQRFRRLFHTPPENFDDLFDSLQFTETYPFILLPREAPAPQLPPNTYRTIPASSARLMNSPTTNLTSEPSDFNEVRRRNTTS